MTRFPSRFATHKDDLNNWRENLHVIMHMTSEQPHIFYNDIMLMAVFMVLVEHFTCEPADENRLIEGVAK